MESECRPNTCFVFHLFLYGWISLKLLCDINHFRFFNSVEPLVGQWTVQSAEPLDVGAEFDVVE